MQTERNAEFSKAQPDLRKLAANSAGSASHTASGVDTKSTGARKPDELLETVGRSTGTETGTGAAREGEIEVGRDATSARTV